VITSDQRSLYSRGLFKCQNVTNHLIPSDTPKTSLPMTIPETNSDKKTFQQRIKNFHDILFSKKVLDIISYLSGWMGFLICVMILPREIKSRIGVIVMYVFFGLFFISLIWRGLNKFMIPRGTTNKTI
jgi:hypothetical protein